MKPPYFIWTLFLCFFLVSIVTPSCRNTGTTDILLTGEETNLPEVLKGIKVYRVFLPYGGNIKIAVKDGTTVSTSYPVGKTQGSFVFPYLDKSPIPIERILFENDSIIICKKFIK